MDELEQTQQAPNETVINNNNDGFGTSSNAGQSETVNQPNDPAHMQSKIEMTQADFTREMQRISEEKKAAELELASMNQRIEAQRQAMQYYQQPPVQQVQQMQSNPLVDQFGQEAGGALINQFNQLQVKLELMQEESKIRQKMGAEYDKYNYKYFNPTTGQEEVRNKIMDKRTMFNPITQQWNTIDDAINSVRSPQELEAQIRQKVLAELQAKQNATPISQTTAPTAAAKGDGSLDDAFRQAFAQHGGL